MGRKQLILLPDSQMNAMGGRAFSEMKSQVPISRDPGWNAYVRCVAMPVVAESRAQMDVRDWEVVVFQDKTANAFALPGGKIGVHTGMLFVAKTDGQLAAVLGHEVGHVIARHGAERVSTAVVGQGGLALVEAFTRGDSQPSTGRSVLFGALGLGLQFGVVMPHGRTQESEADVIGLDLMADAGFDPRESVKLWENMRASGDGQPPEWLSTHPSHETRIQGLQARMGAAGTRVDRARAAGKNPQCRRPG